MRMAMSQTPASTAHAASRRQHLNVLVADTRNHVLRKVACSGTVSTLAGSGYGESGYADAVGAAARFNGPCDVAVEAHGSIFVADSDNRCLRQETGDRTGSTLAGDAEDEAGFADGPPHRRRCPQQLHPSSKNGPARACVQHSKRPHVESTR